MPHRQAPSEDQPYSEDQPPFDCRTPFENGIWERALDWTMALHERPHDPAMATALAQWLAEDSRHALAFDDACAVWEMTGQLVREPKASVGKIDPSPRYRFRAAGAIGIALAASLMLAVILLRTFFAADFQTAAGEFRDVTLADGSKVYLNSNTCLDIAFTGSVRHVHLLEGEAFFAVTPQKDRPFVVRAGDVDVRVLGTRFNVRNRGDALQVAVEHGRVKVERPALGDSLTLGAGGMTSTWSADDALVATPISPSLVGTWRSRQLIVDDWPVSRLIEEIRQHRRGFVVLANPQLSDERISGVFDLRQPAGALQAAMQPFGAAVWEYSPYMLVVSSQAGAIERNH